MIADMLKRIKEQSRKPALSVLLAGTPIEDVARLESILSEATAGARTIEVDSCEQPAELLEAVDRRRFDLAFLYLDQISRRDTAHSFDERQIVERLLGEAETINSSGLTAISFLAKVCAIPVVVLISIWVEGATEWAKEAGAVAVFQAPLCLASFVQDLRQILELTESKRRARPLRIVVVDDDPESVEKVARVVRRWRRDSTVLLFQDGEAAWKQLSTEAPDLLITKMNCPGLSGWKMLPLLAGRKVKYPVLVISENARPSMVRMCAGPELAMTFLRRCGRAWEGHLLSYLSTEIGPSAQIDETITQGSEVDRVLTGAGAEKSRGLYREPSEITL